MNTRDAFIDHVRETLHRRLERELMTAQKAGKNLAVSDPYCILGTVAGASTFNVYFAQLDPGYSPPPAYDAGRPLGWTIYHCANEKAEPEFAFEHPAAEPFNEHVARHAPYLPRQEVDGSWYVVRGGQKAAFGFDKEQEAEEWIAEKEKLS